MIAELPGCARCHFATQDRLCMQEDGKSPTFCPTQNYGEVIEKALDELKKPEVLEFARQASIQEGDGYANREFGYDQVKPVKPRILETMEFARRMDYRRLGLVFCIGLVKEAKVVEKLFSPEGGQALSRIQWLCCRL
jgi:uncharacterized metal-binding protein